MVPTESLYLGAEALTSIPSDALEEAALLIGSTIAQMHAQAVRHPVRPLADGHHARALVRRHAGNAKPLLARATR